MIIISVFCETIRIYLCVYFPGSHDSFANWLDKNGPLGPDCDAAIKDLAKLFGGMIKDIICRWSLTQSLGATAQLKAGIRYFDLRISTKPESEDLYVLHGLYSVTLEKYLTDIKTFLDAHPKEVVLLDLNHFYKMSEFEHKQCVSMILEILGYKMCPLLDMESVTLQTMWDSQLQVLVFYHYTIDNHQFWPGNLIPSPWPNVCDTQKMLAFLEKNYEAGRSASTFYVCQGILTPDTGYVIKHVMSSLKHAVSDKCGKPFVDWLKTKKAGQNGINICIMDFVEEFDYIATVIALNDTLVENK